MACAVRGSIQALDRALFEAASDGTSGARGCPSARTVHFQARRDDAQEERLPQTNHCSIPLEATGGHAAASTGSLICQSILGPTAARGRHRRRGGASDRRPPRPRALRDSPATSRAFSPSVFCEAGRRPANRRPEITVASAAASSPAARTSAVDRFVAFSDDVSSLDLAPAALAPGSGLVAVEAAAGPVADGLEGG